jgi:N-methylhydantoinase B
MHCAPWGLDGGHDGFGNEVTVEIDGHEARDAANAKVFMQRLASKEGFYARSGGGGGFGSPLERDPSRVAFDVHEGYVTAKSALDDYGVVLKADGTVDQAATKALRATMVPQGSKAKKTRKT